MLDASEQGGRAGVIAVLRRPVTEEQHRCREAWRPPADMPGDRPLFRTVHKSGFPGAGVLSGHVVGAVVKRRAAAAGLNPSRLSGHSLRAGFVTQAVRGGADAGSIMRQTDHRSAAMVELYRRENAPLIGNAVTTLGL